MYEEYPWDNEPHVEREYLRNWQGMPSRYTWNSSPLRMHCRQCQSCGYRWDEFDFTYRSFDKLNGRQGDVRIHDICWNCYQCENNHGEVKRIWDGVDAAKRSPTPEKKSGGLKSLGAK